MRITVEKLPYVNTEAVCDVVKCRVFLRPTQHSTFRRPASVARAAVPSQTPPDWESRVTERLMTAGFTEEQARVTKDIIIESPNQVRIITASTGQQKCQLASILSTRIA